MDAMAEAAKVRYWPQFIPAGMVQPKTWYPSVWIRLLDSPYDVLLFQDAEVGGVSLSFCSCFFSNRLSASFLTTVSSGRTHKLNFDTLAHDKGTSLQQWMLMPLAHNGHVTIAHDGHAASTWWLCHLHMTVMPLAHDGHVTIAHDGHAASTWWLCH